MHQFEYERFLELSLLRRPRRSRHYRPRKGALIITFCGAQALLPARLHLLHAHDICVIDAGVIEDAVPQNRDERKMLPSDHIFIRAKIEINN